MTRSGLLRRARAVRLMVFDVDGVFTDGRLWYGPAGEMMKVFHVFDGHGVKMLHASGIRTAILSARNTPAVSARAAELGIAHVRQGIADKAAAFDALLGELGLAAGAAAYMGDDVIDLPVLARCGLACAPANGHPLVRRRAHYVSRARGGHGAVREVCELLLRAQGTFDTAQGAATA